MRNQETSRYLWGTERALFGLAFRLVAFIVIETSLRKRDFHAEMASFIENAGAQ